MTNRHAAEGQWGRVEWALDAEGQCPARDFYETLEAADQAKMLALFQRLAAMGVIINREKFRQLGDKAKRDGAGLFEFKSHQLRFIGDFRPGGRFVIAHAVRKKQDDLRPVDIAVALRILRQNDEAERRAARVKQ